MEKLIELLNEYSEKRRYNGIEEWVEHTKGNLYWKYWENTWSYMVVISKKYGFIKWLVDNDKIDYHNKINYHISLAIHREIKKTTREERLLMMLAIQDNPIEFLISILK